VAVADISLDDAEISNAVLIQASGISPIFPAHSLASTRAGLIAPIRSRAAGGHVTVVVEAKLDEAGAVTQVVLSINSIDGRMALIVRVFLEFLQLPRISRTA
jgi:hypothetical protein